MVTGLGRKFIGQMGAAAAGKGGVRRFSAGPAGGRVTPPPAQGSSRTAFHPIVQKHFGDVFLTVCTFACLDYVVDGPVYTGVNRVIKKIKGFGEGLKNLVVGKEVIRPLPTEVNTAQVEQIGEWGGSEFERNRMWGSEYGRNRMWGEFERNREWGAPFKA